MVRSCIAVAVSIALVSCQEPIRHTPGGLTSGMFKVDGGEIYYEMKGGGPTVVFIHGGFVDRRMWNQQFEVFGLQYRVIRYDLRGFGLSTMPDRPYSPVDDLDRLLRHFGVHDARLVGLSMGGGVALNYALEHPDMVEALVLASSAPVGYPVPEQDRRRIIDLFETAQEHGDTAAVTLWLESPMLTVVREQPVVLETMRELSMNNRRFFMLEFWPLHYGEPSDMERLDEIDIPTLIITGDRDIELIRTASDIMGLQIEGAREVVVTGADHMVNMVKPEDFNTAVINFFADL